MFVKSFDETAVNYRHEVSAISNGGDELSDVDWDTGKKTMQGEYSLADKTYSDWVIKLKDKKFETVTSSIKKNILAFYKNYPDPNNEEQWQQTSAALEELKKGE